MPQLKSRPSHCLTNLHERAIAKLAMKAACDCYDGGMGALVLAKRMDRIHHTREYEDIVTANYHSSHPPVAEYTPYECPECGQVWLGEGAARLCCATSYEDECPETQDAETQDEE